MTNKYNIKVIAFYLPQFHPIAENDKWWGKGFTEWTNVGKAKPLYKGHDQPKVPADLGYYDLRLPEVREMQAELAIEAGVYGFCYWHYWFGNGKRLLENIFDEVLNTGKPDFPFCLAWANHSWYAKDWNSESQNESILLIEQTYPDKQDYINHFNYCLEAFRDKRYIKINNMPVFYIYDVSTLPKDFTSIWTDLAIENGFDGIHFVGRRQFFQNNEDLFEKGMNALTAERMSYYFNNVSKIDKLFNKIYKSIFGTRLRKVEYKNAFPHFIDQQEDSQEFFYPAIIPNWDHSPRSGKNATILHNSTPSLFKQHVQQVINLVKNKKTENRIVFLKSWNEWGEGNYLEPDLRFGKKYIETLKEALNE